MKKVRVVKLTKTQFAENNFLVYLEGVGTNAIKGLGRTKIIFSSFTGDPNTIKVGTEIEIPMENIREITGTDGKVREWLMA
jgi:hypothetical protein